MALERTQGTTSNEASTWDKRYGNPDEYAYGTAPNVFIAAAATKYLAGKQHHVVELASGEGRNVVYLAQQGHVVEAVDFSSEGLKKTAALAESKGCGQNIKYHEADIMTWQPQEGAGSIDAVVMSFCHVPLEQKPKFFTNLISMLKPGGLLLLECFHPDQIAKGYREKSGGPPVPTMMFTLQELRDLLPADQGQELEAAQVEYELHEGKYHAGLGAVTRFVWRKNQ